MSSVVGWNCTMKIVLFHFFSLYFCKLCKYICIMSNINSDHVTANSSINRNAKREIQKRKLIFFFYVRTNNFFVDMFNLFVCYFHVYFFLLLCFLTLHIFDRVCLHKCFSDDYWRLQRDVLWDVHNFAKQVSSILAHKKHTRNKKL